MGGKVVSGGNCGFRSRQRWRGSAGHAARPRRRTLTRKRVCRSHRTTRPRRLARAERSADATQSRRRLARRRSSRRCREGPRVRAKAAAGRSNSVPACRIVAARSRRRGRCATCRKRCVLPRPAAVASSLYVRAGLAGSERSRESRACFCRSASAHAGMDRCLGQLRCRPIQPGRHRRRQGCDASGAQVRAEPFDGVIKSRRLYADQRRIRSRRTVVARNYRPGSKQHRSAA